MHYFLLNLKLIQYHTMWSLLFHIYFRWSIDGFWHYFLVCWEPSGLPIKDTWESIWAFLQWIRDPVKHCMTSLSKGVTGFLDAYICQTCNRLSFDAVYFKEFDIFWNLENLHKVVPIRLRPIRTKERYQWQEFFQVTTKPCNAIERHDPSIWAKAAGSYYVCQDWTVHTKVIATRKQNGTVAWW